jgi:hypothetical protein
MAWPPWWARPNFPSFPHTRLPLRRLTGVKGGACAIALATPLTPVSRRRMIPGTIEGTEIHCECFGCRPRPSTRDPTSYV